MPIYEFYCRPCHTVYSFFSARVDTEARAACPRCGHSPLGRRPSRFATLKHQGGDEPDPLAGLDEDRLEGAMDTLMAEMGDLGDDEDPDPRTLGKLMRRFGDLTGLELGGPMEDYVRRLEAGEDPEALESEMGDSLGDDADDLFQLKQALRQRARRPKVDEELYFL